MCLQLGRRHLAGFKTDGAKPLQLHPSTQHPSALTSSLVSSTSAASLLTSSGDIFLSAIVDPPNCPSLIIGRKRFGQNPPRPNAGRQPLPEAGATQERTLEAVACKPLLGRLRNTSLITGHSNALLGLVRLPVSTILPVKHELMYLLVPLSMDH